MPAKGVEQSMVRISSKLGYGAKEAGQAELKNEASHTHHKQEESSCFRWQARGLYTVLAFVLPSRKKSARLLARYKSAVTDGGAVEVELDDDALEAKGVLLLCSSLFVVRCAQL